MNSITPTIGRVVLFRSSDLELTGGAPEVPALITRVWSDDCVNLQVLRDGHGATPIGVTSVCYAELPELVDGADQYEAGRAWRWMPYQQARAAAGA
jgi:hypothetical protein